MALVLPNRPEFFEITWGCQLSGLYYSAVNTHFTPDEVAYVIDDSDAKAVFIDASWPNERSSRSESASTSASYEARWDATEPVSAPPISDGSEMLYSSGTTGRPKAVRRPLPETARARGRKRCWSTRSAQRYGMTESSVYLSPRRSTTRRESTTRWRYTGWAPPRS